MQEQVQDLRQSIIELPDTFQYSCFHLEHNGVRINDFIELSDIEGFSAGDEVRLIEDPYTDKEARLHTIRVRELIGAAGNKVDQVHGVCAGLSLHEYVVPLDPPEWVSRKGQPGDKSTLSSHAMADYDFDAPASVRTVLPPPRAFPPKTVKSLCVSAWNPPPSHLRQQGHLLYLQLTTNEGEQHQITAHVSGFYVNKSSNAKFDPFPRPAPKNAAAHSLLTLISKLSPSFDASFKGLQEYNSRQEPLANFQITHSLPSNPWLVSASESSLSAHQPDVTRTQENLLLCGLENAETLRDWNEEIQSTRELPKETVQDRVFRERITTKLFADYNEAAVRGAMLVANGEIAPLNPTEKKDAQIYVYSNIFFSFGSDGVGTFASDGGDEAARVAVGKDVTGVRIVNQLDIKDLFTPGTIVVDYLGRRIVAQSIVPGIFKQREPGEHQIDYGAVEGREVIAENEAFVPPFSALSKALKVKKHDVCDKEGNKHTLEGSVETKGLLGTDGRKYVLDLYRLTPLDILWIEKHWNDGPSEVDEGETPSYPHRMSVLRPELIDIYWQFKVGEYIGEEVRKKQNGQKTNKSEVQNGERSAEDNSDKVSGQGHRNATGSATNSDRALQSSTATDDGKAFLVNGDSADATEQGERIDISGFSLRLNPDVFYSQPPHENQDKEELAKDEEDVRAVCEYLHGVVIPELVSICFEYPRSELTTDQQVEDLKNGDVGFPMDGQTLSRLMHKRGINVRYLGMIASMAKQQGPRLGALNGLAIQEMVARAFKHVSNRYLKALPLVFTAPCIAHLLNCLLGTGLNMSPKALTDEDLQSLYTDVDWSFVEVTPEGLLVEIRNQVNLRYRYDLDHDFIGKLKPLQLLREVSLKLGLQLIARDYQFLAPQQPGVEGPDIPKETLAAPNSNQGISNNMNGKRKKKNGDHVSSPTISESMPFKDPTTFEASDIVNFVAVVKDSCPRSVLAEEAMEAGRISIMQNQKELGQELLLESLSLHEQIYGILHPEVARVYHQLSMLYYQMDEKNAAVELAHKAVLVSERTLGVDSNETILNYLNLGLFEHANGNTKVALGYVRHAMELWKIIYGSNHPDSITTINNAAVMLQNLKHYHDSRLWFETSLAICESFSGKQSVNTATLCFQLAQALALDQDAKGAVNRMREAYSIFHTKLGPDDRNTKESESWLEQLTQNAVSIAKHAKDVQNRRLRRIQLNPKVTLATHPQLQVGQSSADTNLGRDSLHSLGIDSRSVDELMRFIEGGGDTTKRTTKKRTQRSNPKRRGSSRLSTPA